MGFAGVHYTINKNELNSWTCKMGHIWHNGENVMNQELLFIQLYVPEI